MSSITCSRVFYAIDPGAGRQCRCLDHGFLPIESTSTRPVLGLVGPATLLAVTSETTCCPFWTHCAPAQIPLCGSEEDGVDRRGHSVFAVAPIPTGLAPSARVGGPPAHRTFRLHELW